MFEAHLSARPRPGDPSQAYNHSRTRTTSSNIFPAQQQQQQPPQLSLQMQMHGQYQQQPPQQPHYQQQQQQQQLPQSHMTHAQRSASVNTFSTVSSGGMVPPAAYRTSPTTKHTDDAVRRSTSSRSGASVSQTSYVALLRRQKGTVWSERAQFEDPRISAQQRAARIRANREILGSSGGGSSYLGGYPGGPGGGRTSTGLSSAGGKVAAKIRHHGKASTLGIGGYGADSNYVGIGGVPLRLSATEVEPEDSEDEDTGFMGRAPNHRRTGSSGRSSTASGRRGPPYHHTSTGALNAAAASASGTNSLQTKTPERPSSLVDDTALPRDDAASGKARSTASGSSAERADAVPDLSAAGAGRVATAAAANSTAHSALTRERSTRNPEDLRRRGSVDERTMTLSAGRLFIANPD